MLEEINVPQQCKKDIVSNVDDSKTRQFGQLSSEVLCLLPLRNNGNNIIATLESTGVIRFYETDLQALTQRLSTWKEMVGMDIPEERLQKNVDDSLKHGNRTTEGVGKPRFGVDAPKHGKIDPENNPHVGGNTWAGGTGGSDTAGLGGRGGPYRLDSGNPVHQVENCHLYSPSYCLLGIRTR